MRRLLVFLLAVASLATAATADGARTASTATQTVTITRAGYKPSTVTLTVGDTVVFKNSDTIAHTVDIKPATGVHCSAALPLVIQAAQSASCTFSSIGKFKFSDPTNAGKGFRGTVTVGPVLVSSLAITPKVVVYGGKSTLAGKLASGQAGQSLQVLAQPCGEKKATLAATVTTTTGGAFSYQAQPSKHTAYTVQVKNVSSSAITVKVKPRLRLAKVGRHRYRVRVFAAQSFTGKVATFQRYRPALKRWVKVKRVRLGASALGVAPTVITSATFRSHIKARQRVRASLGPRQVGSCYLAGRSNTIRSG